MSQSWIGKALIAPGAHRKAVLVGRIILVSEVDDLVVVARASRIKENGHVDNYVPSPRVQSRSKLQQQLDSGDGHRLVDFETPAPVATQTAPLVATQTAPPGRGELKH